MSKNVNFLVVEIYLSAGSRSTPLIIKMDDNLRIY
jgi:hypothetical protein